MISPGAARVVSPGHAAGGPPSAPGSDALIGALGVRESDVEVFGPAAGAGPPVQSTSWVWHWPRVRIWRLRAIAPERWPPRLICETHADELRRRYHAARGMEAAQRQPSGCVGRRADRR